jgi:hypothetical protein
MLEPRYTRELRRIQEEIGTDDPRFVEGLRLGRPCPPREYRDDKRRRLGLLVPPVTAVAIALTALTVAVPVGLFIAIALGLAGLLGSVVLGSPRR